MATDINTAVLSAAAQINPMIAVAAGIIQAVKQIRDAAKAANPAGAAELPSDAEIIGKFISSAKLLETESAELLAWLKTLPDSK